MIKKPEWTANLLAPTRRLLIYVLLKTTLIIALLLLSGGSEVFQMDVVYQGF